MIALFVISAASPLIAFWLFSNLVSSMPKAEQWVTVGKGPGFVLLYSWAYDFLHVVAGNAPHVFPSLRYKPQEKE